MPAAGDCELIRDAFLAQPANALSSLAFIAVGLVVARSRPTIGILATGVGVASFLFHGPMPGWAEWAHDVTLAGLLAGLALESRTRVLATVVAVMALIFALWTTVAETITAVIAVAAVVSVGRDLRVQPSRWRGPALALLLVGLFILGISRTNGPMCDPASLLQGHAAWHLLAAGALLAFTHIDSPAVASR
ncbi:MAG: hypothetical protein GY722_27955 [bacterium]|nr:hypothetical protein [bacterium]